MQVKLIKNAGNLVKKVSNIFSKELIKNAGIFRGLNSCLFLTLVS